MRRLAILAVLSTPGLLACQGGVPVEEAVASITETDFMTKLEIIAHDSMLGRANPSPGLDMTAQWIADEFQRYGLKPGGDNGTFIQSYRMTEIAADFENSSAQVAGGPALEFGVDISFMRSSAGGPATGSVVVLTGDLAGGGELPAEEITGKHVIVVPAAADPAQTGRRRVRFPSGLTAAEPASVIFVDSNSDEDWAAAVDRVRNQRQRQAPWATAGPSGPPMLYVRESSLAPLLADQGIQLARLTGQVGGQLAAVQLPGLEFTVTTATQEVGGYDLPNTVGILEGSDPELKNEYLLYSAHMDHVGVGRPNEAGDSIRNGADDDGSGTISVVEVAEAFSMLADRPKRSIIFLAVSGEEAGLLGSRNFAENPVAPLEQVVANLNSDMISRNATDTIVAIGKEHSDLGATLARVNDAHPELNLTAVDDMWPDQNFYRRSDHFNFARRGVPILFFFCGTTEDYHQPSDEISKVDGLKATNTTKLLFYLGLELANSPDRPQWNPESYAEIVDGGG
ncbi:M20/M25/M40 family metallo-hydrolase [Gemmatimonadota bacterium]